MAFGIRQVHFGQCLGELLRQLLHCVDILPKICPCNRDQEGSILSPLTQWPVPNYPKTISSSFPKIIYIACHLLVNLSFTKGFPGGASGKELACQCRRCNRHGLDPWVGKIPQRRKRQPTPVLLPGKSHGQRSSVGYSPWGPKESETTQWLSLHAWSCVG